MSNSQKNFYQSKEKTVPKNTGLGQGVGLLFGASADEERYFECKIDNILPNKHQPRSHFDEESLRELADSIKENGVIQPLVVQAASARGKYELVAGERRLRASKLAGLEKVPVIVMDLKDEDSLLELALIENIQRTDLNAIEEAEAYQKLIDKFGYTQEATAKRVGKNRSTITNMLRLLSLPDFIKQDVVSQTLSEGHARALLKLVSNPDTLKRVRDEVILKQLSVRQTEKLAKKESATATSSNRQMRQKEESGLPQAYSTALVNQLSSKLGTKVTIQQNGAKGRVEIEYYSQDDFKRLTRLLLSE